MPTTVSAPVAGGTEYNNPAVGPVDHTVAVRVDVSALTNTLVDANGWLKPGALLTRAGLPIAATNPLYGWVIEAVKVAANNGAGLAAAVDIDVTVGVMGALNRKLIEDNLGRVLNADELASFGVALHSPIALLY